MKLLRAEGVDRSGLQTRVAHIYFDISVGVRKEIINWLFFAAVLAIKSWCFWRQILAGCRRISHRTLKQFEPAAKIKSLSVRLTSQTNLLRSRVISSWKCVSVRLFTFFPWNLPLNSCSILSPPIDQRLVSASHIDWPLTEFNLLLKLPFFPFGDRNIA